MAQRLASALAMGNTAVVCPSPLTPLSTLLFAEVCRGAGLPSGVVNVVNAEDASSERWKLAMREEVMKVSFVGNTDVSVTFTCCIHWQ